jgi:uncharacterized phage protein gp47/JayE
MTTPVCTIDAYGIHRPPLAAILDWYAGQFRAIYGSDVSLDPSTTDGEWLGLLASALDDANAMAVAAYQAFSPSTAQGVGLSSVVKINGISRAVPSFSTAPMLIGGQAGSPISNGVVTDENNYAWSLPASVTIPYSGQILVTATCQTQGAIAAPANTITTISNPQPGWQTATNTAAATLGSPVENDARLRSRQSNSTMNVSTAILDGIEGALLALPNVSRAAVYENEGNIPDANGIPGHCIAVVIDGGDLQAIAQTIKTKKGGCGTYGSTSQVVTSALTGIPSTVNFFLVAEPLITVAITVKQLAGFTTDAEIAIANSIAAWGNNLGIGKGVQITRLYAAAYLFGSAQGQTYEVQAITIARDGLTPTANDVAINFNEAALFLAANVIVTVLT